MFMRISHLISTCLSILFITNLQAQYYGVDNPKVENWSIGINLGIGSLIGDVQMDQVGYQGGMYVQKSISNAVDIRFGFQVGNNSGLDITPTSGFLFNSALNGVRDSMHAYDSTDQVYHNFSTNYGDVSVLFKINIDRLINPSGSQKFEVYALAGIGLFFYQTHVNVFDERTNMVYPYDSISTADPIGIKNQLKNMLDPSYETLAQQDELNSSRVGNYIMNSEFVLGLGTAFMLNDHISLGVEGKIYFVGDDLLDGQQFWDDNTQSLTNDRPAMLSIILDYAF